MKPYTWEEIAKASKKEKKLIVETHGMLGAVAIELAQSLDGQDTPSREDCAVYQFLDEEPGDFRGFCSKCPVKADSCGYEDDGKKNLIELYAKLCHEKYGKK
jgi:hypothetical protein